MQCCNGFYNWQLDKWYNGKTWEHVFSQQWGCPSTVFVWRPRATPPLLKGKGAEARHLVPILCTVWHRHVRPDNRYEGHIGVVIDSLHAFYEGLDSKVNGMFPFHLPTAVSQKVMTDVVTCLQEYSLLTKHLGS